MHNKILSLILLLVVSLFTVQIVNAVPAAPSPTCEITASVLKVEKTRTNMGDLGQAPREDFDYYKVNLAILEISTYKQEDGQACDNSYIDPAEKSGQILSLDEYNKNPISEGQKIQARINFTGDEWFSGYFLSAIQIFEDTTTPDKKGLELSYWYFVIPLIIILLVVVFYLLFRKR